MSLTDNLVDGIFYYTSSGIEKCHICTVNGIKEVVTPKGSVWQPVPSYDHFVELTEKVERLDDRVRWEIGKNNALEKQLIETREEIKRGRKALELMCDSNDELSQMLKDSAYILNEYKHYFDVKHHNMAAVIIEKANEVLR